MEGATSSSARDPKDFLSLDIEYENSYLYSFQRLRHLRPSNERPSFLIRSLYPRLRYTKNSNQYHQITYLLTTTNGNFGLC